MLKNDQLILFFAEAYREAALANVNMRAATEALETTRIAMLAEGDLLAAWDTIDAQANRAADVRGLQPLLMSLREQWKKLIFDDECERLKSIFANDAHTGWIAWLHSFGRALAAFRLDCCKQLCEAPLPFPQIGDPSISWILLLTERARHGRWAEAFDLYVKLGEYEALRPELRARLLAIAAEIVVYHFYQYDCAKDLLEHGQGLAPDEWRIKYGWGIYYFQQSGEKNQAKAREYYQRLIELAPEVSSGYIGFGDCLEKDGDLTGAEAKYQQAAKCLIAPIDGYSSLLQLHGQKAIFENRQNDIPVLIERCKAVALSDYDYYQAMIDAGYAYQLNDRHDEAHRWYRRAIEFSPTLLQAYTNEGYLYLGDKDYPHTIENFQQAIDVAPEAMDGYWGMSWVTDEQQDWEATLHWCQESLKQRPQWGGFIHARIGKIKRQLNQIEEAIEEFFKALKVDPKNSDARDGLEQIASECYKQHNDGSLVICVAGYRLYALDN